MDTRKEVRDVYVRPFHGILQAEGVNNEHVIVEIELDDCGGIGLDDLIICA